MGATTTWFLFTFKLKWIHVTQAGPSAHLVTQAGHDPVIDLLQPLLGLQVCAISLILVFHKAELA